jgi:hypothetical protein
MEFWGWRFSYCQCRSENSVRSVLNPLVILGAIFVAVILLAATVGLLWYTRPGPTFASPETAVLNVIAIPTSTPIPSTPTPQAAGTPTLPVPSSSDGNIAVGVSVQISGTGGDGLRLRADPDLKGEVRYLALESEIFEVKDGPRQAGGYTWWFLVAPYDEKVQGWAVANYLKVVPSQ